MSPNCCACWAASAAASQAPGQPKAQARLSQPEPHSNRLAPLTCGLLPQCVSSVFPCSATSTWTHSTPPASRKWCLRCPTRPGTAATSRACRWGWAGALWGWGCANRRQVVAVECAGGQGLLLLGLQAVQDGLVGVQVHPLYFEEIWGFATSLQVAGKSCPYHRRFRTSLLAPALLRLLASC